MTARWHHDFWPVAQSPQTFKGVVFSEIAAISLSSDDQEMTLRSSQASCFDLMVTALQPYDI